MTARTKAANLKLNNRAAVGWILTSVVSASTMTIVVRQLTLEFDSRVIVLYRAGLTLLVITLALAVFSTWRKQIQFTRPWMHVWRGLAFGISGHLGFYAIAHLELVTATVLFFSAPIWATIFGLFINNESIGPRRIAAIIAGFAGVLIVLRPGVLPLDVAMLTALGSAMIFGFALTLSRTVAGPDGTLSAFLSSVAIMFLVSIPLVGEIPPTPATDITWLLLGAVAATGMIRSAADLQAYKIGEASLLAPFTYLRIVLIGAAGFAFFNEVPDGAALIGAVIIVGAALYIAHREGLRRTPRKRTD